MTAKPLHSLSILIVEDQVDVAESLAELLQLMGYQIRVANSGEAALTKVGECLPDVILLDIGLPGMNGWETARQIRNGATTRQPVVVAVTGFGLDADKWRSADAGVDLHLVKPVAPAVLTKLLERVRDSLGTLPTPVASAVSETKMDEPAGPVTP